MEDPLPCHEELRKLGKSLGSECADYLGLGGCRVYSYLVPHSIWNIGLLGYIQEFWVTFGGFRSLLGVRALNPVVLLPFAGLGWFR